MNFGPRQMVSVDMSCASCGNHISELPFQPTSGRPVYCNECNRIVYFCHTSDDLMAAMQADLCVAIENSEPDAGPFVVGMLKSRYGGDL